MEVDGGQHAEKNADVERDTWLKSQEFHILRFWNNQVLRERDVVKKMIWKALCISHEPPHLSPPPQGGRKKSTQSIHTQTTSIRSQPW